ncbi:hypothetical protein [Enterococcus faecium]|uniref:hypothetical protein n=1 Tax=Enterococcus faecium TaxID=1352 RepID=UPI00189C96FE|nr:hypothetical protein [Enterococcus faecium]
MPATLNAYDGYDYRKKIVKKLYGATYGNVVSVLSVTPPSFGHCGGSRRRSGKWRVAS